MSKKVILTATGLVAGLALAAALFAWHSTPSQETGAESRPAGTSEIQPPPKPQQLKPVERVVVTSK